MKRGIWIAIMVWVAVFVCACGRDSTEAIPEQESGRTEKQPAPTTEAVSGQAAGESENPVVSADRAFSMAEELLKTMTLEEKIGQMFMLHLSQLDDSRTWDGNRYSVTPKIRRMIKKYNIGGIFLTSNNIATEKQTKKLTKDLQSCASGGALFVAVEEEIGGENSISADVPFWKEADGITPEQMGREMDEEQIYEKSRRTAEEIAALGINMNLAPICDIASEANPHYAVRCMGNDAEYVADLTEQFVRGMKAGGLGTTLKYFPGIGNTAGDFRVALLENNESLMTLRNTNFTPYSAGIDGGADAVMVSSVSVNKVTVDKIPAFLSRDIVTSLLREELGFQGIIMTPFLNETLIQDKYTSAFVSAEAVKAGCDMLVLPSDWQEGYKSLVSEVRRGSIDEKVINTAAQRILQNKIMRGILVLEQ